MPAISCEPFSLCESDQVLTTLLMLLLLVLLVLVLHCCLHCITSASCCQCYAQPPTLKTFIAMKHVFWAVGASCTQKMLDQTPAWAQFNCWQHHHSLLSLVGCMRELTAAEALQAYLLQRMRGAAATRELRPEASIV
jgi:hypothetical protein